MFTTPNPNVDKIRKSRTYRAAIGAIVGAASDAGTLTTLTAADYDIVCAMPAVQAVAVKFGVPAGRVAGDVANAAEDAIDMGAPL